MIKGHPEDPLTPDVFVSEPAHKEKNYAGKKAMCAQQSSHTLMSSRGSELLHTADHV